MFPQVTKQGAFSSTDYMVILYKEMTKQRSLQLHQVGCAYNNGVIWGGEEP